MTETTDTAARWSLAIHGGAGAMTPEIMDAAMAAEYEAALATALEAGAAVLRDGGSALDAVSAAVSALEDDPHFNAGRGAVFTYHGTNELDAAIMDGRNRAAGAVSAVTRTRNPVQLARVVMEQGPHVFLAGAGAEEFARDHGMGEVDPAWFATAERRRQLDEFKSRKDGWFDADLKFGTVGAVARDANGDLAAATSTGGLTGKRWNRIGDSPVIGAGTYADNRACAVSCTGTGEVFIRVGVAHEIAARMRLAGEDVATATRAVLGEVGNLGGVGGIIAVDAEGTLTHAFNTNGLYRGFADHTGRAEVGIFGPA
jgi:L-asparaginase / beta-aspartyl-peptidase